MVLNVSEMEAKVREATNDDPWSVDSFPWWLWRLSDALIEGVRVRLSCKKSHRGKSFYIVFISAPDKLSVV